MARIQKLTEAEAGERQFRPMKCLLDSDSSRATVFSTSDSSWRLAVHRDLSTAEHHVRYIEQNILYYCRTPC